MFKEERGTGLNMLDKIIFFNKKARASLIIFNLVLSIVAFGAIIGLASERVSGEKQQSGGPTSQLGVIGSFLASLLGLSNNNVAPPAALSSESQATLARIRAANPNLASGIDTVLKRGDSAGAERIIGEWGKNNPDYTKGYDSVVGNIDVGGSAMNLFAGKIVNGFIYSGMAVAAVQMIGSLTGLDSGITNAASLGAFAGIMVGHGAAGLGMNTGLIGATGLGIGVGLLVFALTYSKTDTKEIKFTCDVWEPPRGGANCEKCNLDDENYPCSEYKCKSLGASCQLLNAGTGEEKCAWVNPKDVSSATIAPNYEAISDGHEYRNVKLRPPGTGMEIANRESDDGCVEAFFPLKFGIVTNEPTKCKIDYNHTQNVEQMSYFVGGSSTFKYNHTQTLALPGPANINSEFPEIQNDGIYSLFVRCEDANGNVNEDEFAVKFCVNKGPDTTPAKVESTSLINNMPVSYNTTETEMLVYLNEPAECKWSKEDKDYDVMENEMKCSESIREVNNQMLYPCVATLSGIENRKDNKFYFRCKDQPFAEENIRNTNQDSYLFTIKGTQPLNILKSEPNNTIEGATPIVGIDLKLETGNGYKDGDSICYYSLTGNDRDWIKFFETGGYLHRQRQDLTEGNYTYYFKCVDLGGNADYNQTEFNIYVDDVAPQVVRAYHDSSESQVCGGAGCIKIVTDEESTCTYSTSSCNFEIDNGIKMPYDKSKEHYVEWDTGFNYYVKCKDKSDNQPLPTECSITLKAYNEK